MMIKKDLKHLKYLGHLKEKRLNEFKIKRPKQLKEQKRPTSMKNQKTWNGKPSRSRSIV